MAATRKPLQFLLGRVSRTGRRSYGAGGESNSSSSSSSSSSASDQLVNLEYEYSAHNYHPVPVVFSQAKGSTIWDPEGKKYLDFLSAYSAVNQPPIVGTLSSKIIKAFQEQAERLTLRSRAFYNDRFPIFAELLTSMFGYKMLLPMNTGAEGVETALKLARKWGYEKKKIPKD